MSLIFTACNYSLVKSTRVLHLQNGFLFLTKDQFRQFFIKSECTELTDSNLTSLINRSYKLKANALTLPIPSNFYFEQYKTLKYKWVMDNTVDSFTVIPVKILYAYSSNRGARNSIKYKIQFENHRETLFYLDRTISCISIQPIPKEIGEIDNTSAE